VEGHDEDARDDFPTGRKRMEYAPEEEGLGDGFIEDDEIDGEAEFNDDE